jgi:hypothetical protein
MARLDVQYPLGDTDPLLAELRSLVTAIENRLAAIEGGVVVQYQTALAELQADGQDALSEIVQPVFDDISAMASLGAIFSATSTSSVTLGLGLKTLTIPSPARDRFAPAGFLAAIDSGNANRALMGSLSSYTRTTGALIINVVAATGVPASGTTTISSWTIVPCAPPMVPTTVDSGLFGGAPPSTAYIPFVAVAP